MKRTTSEHRTTPAQKAFLLLFGALLILLLEGALRLAGVGGETALFLRRPGPEGREVYVNNEALNRRLFFPVTSEAFNFPRPQIPYARFDTEKRDGVFRFFTVGASSSVAFPYGPNASFASLLREMLAAGMPGREVEGINVSMTAVSSYQVARWAEEILARYDPDLLVVYTGHNEFYGVLGAGSAMSVGRNRTVTRLFQRLQETALYALVAGAIEKARRPPEGTARTQPIEAMTRERAIPFDGELHRAVERNYEANLEGIARAAEKRGVPVLFCTPVCNRTDCSPMGPIARADRTEAERHRWERHLSTGDSRLRLGEAAAAAEEYRSAAVVDSGHAGAPYRLGRALLAAEDRKGAAAAFDRALLLDGVRLRANDRLLEAVRRVCRRHGPGGVIRLADTAARFDRASPAGRPGANLVLEHVHMNTRGHWLAASEIYRTLRASGAVGPLPASGELPFEEAAARAGVGRLDRAYGLVFTRIMLERWPFHGTWRNEERMREMERAEEEALAALDSLEREVFAKDGVRIPMPQIVHRVGLALLERDEAERAAERFRLLARLFPVTPAVRILHARALLAAGQPEEAAGAAREAVFYAPENGEAAALLARSLLGAGDERAAREALRAARDRGADLGEAIAADPALAGLLND